MKQAYRYDARLDMSTPPLVLRPGPVSVVVFRFTVPVPYHQSCELVREFCPRFSWMLLYVGETLHVFGRTINLAKVPESTRQPLDRSQSDGSWFVQPLSGPWFRVLRCRRYPALCALQQRLVSFKFRWCPVLASKRRFGIDFAVLF